ncbi:MAG: transcriptional regulator [Desulfobulbaceae bacterium]|nr:MAG: transcriptional regulator [Desulfobulbaceae bacterium]
MTIMFSKFSPKTALKKLFSSKEEVVDKPSANFDKVREEEKAYKTIERGNREVPLNQIVGSVGRYHDFDEKFRPRSHGSDEKLERLIKDMSVGKSFPPISLYQIKDNYYILDGHHRFSAAKHLGHDSIRAHILELIPSKDTLENQLYLEKIEFRDKYSLTNTITLTEPGQYRYLTEQIEEHAHYLRKESPQLTTAQAAADWYKTIYVPLYRIIFNSGLVNSFQTRTADDLYLYISTHQWKEKKSRHFGIGIDKLIPKNMEEFRNAMAERKEQEYPDMKREITAFILMNVEGRHEEKILDKLLALDEVREIHSVHGNIDIIIRVKLMRDLLSSDAELISQFTQSTIRQWNGVVSTQTLLPGVSHLKPDDRCPI